VSVPLSIAIVKCKEEIMKGKFMKKALAAALSAAMVFSLPSFSGMQEASAASKFVGLNTSFKTLKVGQKNYKLKLVNNTMNWKIKKVTTTDKTIATVYGKTASYVKLKGKSEGRATIRVKVKTAERKANNTKTLRCRVKVVAAQTPAPTPDVQEPVQTSATAATQAELTEALANPALTQLTFKTDSTGTFTIPAASYKNLNLVVDAPNADVVNSAAFKSITILGIKDSTWTEKATGNAFSVETAKARIVVDEGASVSDISIKKAGADVIVVVNGTLARVSVNVKAKLALSGTSKTKPAVNIAAGAAGAEVTSELPADITAAADAVVELKEKAETSTVKITSTSATVTVKNNTTAKVTVTKADGKTQDVAKGASLTVKASTSTVPSGNVSGGSSWGGGSWSSGGSGSSTSNVKSFKAATNEELKDVLKQAANWSSGAQVTIYDATTGKNDTEITIDAADYNNVSLVVDAPSKTVNNYATFKSIEIQNISGDTWREFAKRNQLKISAPNPHIEIEEGADVASVSFNKAAEKVTLNVMGKISGGLAFNAPVKDTSVTVAKGAELAGVSFSKAAEAAKVDLNVEGKITGTVSCQAKATLNVIAKAADALASLVKFVVAGGMDVKIDTADNVKLDNTVTVELDDSAKLTTSVKVDVEAKEENVKVEFSGDAKGSTVVYKQGVEKVTIVTNVEVTIKDESTKEEQKIENASGAVYVDGTQVALDPTALSLMVGKSGTFDVSLKDKEGNLINTSDYTITNCQSADSEVAEAKNEAGTVTVTAKKAGEAVVKVTVKYNEKEYEGTCTVTVTEKPVVTAVLEPSQVNLAAGETKDLTLSVKSGETALTSGYTVVYSSSNDAVATVTGTNTNATVTAEKEGDATITATVTVDGESDAVTATSTVNVAATAAVPKVTIATEGLHATPKTGSPSALAAICISESAIEIKDSTGVNVKKSIDGVKIADKSVDPSNNAYVYEILEGEDATTPKEYAIEISFTDNKDNSYTGTGTITVKFEGNELTVSISMNEIKVNDTQTS